MRKEKFIKLYNEFAPRIYRFILLKTSSVPDSEDLSSEVFFKFWKNFCEKREKIKNPQALLYKIAVNLVTDFYRKKPKTALMVSPENHQILDKIQEKADLNEMVGQDMEMSMIRKALKGIKQEYQDIIIWRYLDDFSVQEIAEILEKPENSVRVLTHRALKALKKKVRT